MSQDRATFDPTTGDSVFDAKTLGTFALELLNKTTLEELTWGLARSVGEFLGFEDCVIYLEEEGRLVQVAAYGIKSADEETIHNPIEIEIGQGIVGTVFSTGQAELVSDTAADPRYIFDEYSGRSELAIPISFEGKVIGVLDSESRDLNGFTDFDLQRFEIIANLCAPRIVQCQTQRSLDNALDELRRYQQSLEQQILEQTVAIRESERRVRLLLDSTAEGIYGLDLDGKCTFCNNAAVAALAYDSEADLLGQRLDSLILSKDGTKLPNESEEHPSESAQLSLSRRDGTQFRAEIRSRPIIRAGSIIGSVSTFWDITEQLSAEQERVRLEEQLRRSQKMEAIGTLAGGIAHDFNNMLTSICGFTELAVASLPMDHPSREHLAQVEAVSDRAADLTRQILSFSSSNAGERQVIDLVGVLQESMKLLRPTTPTSVALDLNTKIEQAPVLADETQMHQVMVNLISNAAAAIGKSQGKIEVLLCVAPGSDGFFLLRVSDSGTGIDREDLSQVFDPFFTTKPIGEGTGLGLAVVHSIVQDLGGSISVRSDAGKGTCFEVLLPMADGDVESRPETKRETVPGEGHILVIDDENMIRNLFERILVTSGYRVTTATNGVDGLGLFRDNATDVDLVITDETMPEMTGSELAREILAERPHLPIILLSGFNRSLSSEEASQMGIARYLAKPVQLSQLTGIVSELLAKSRENA